MSTTKIPYWQKLQDPRWQKKRLEILERDKFTCLSCGSITETLHVHHTAYDRDREPWEYSQSLITLCEQCHEERKRIEQSMLISCSRLTNRELSCIALVFGRLSGLKTEEVK